MISDGEQVVETYDFDRIHFVVGVVKPPETTEIEILSGTTRNGHEAVNGSSIISYHIIRWTNLDFELTEKRLMCNTPCGYYFYF